MSLWHLPKHENTKDSQPQQNSFFIHIQSRTGKLKKRKSRINIIGTQTRTNGGIFS
jgi:hypothetical protein